jgi:hypothetical protein
MSGGLIAPSRRPLKPNQARSDFDPDGFRRLVATHGLRCRWELAAECPCRASVQDRVPPAELAPLWAEASGAAWQVQTPRVSCVACGGSGVLYHSAQEIRAVILSASSSPQLAQIYGGKARGLVQVSTLPEHLPAHSDRFVLLDSVRRVREARVVSGGAVALAFPVRSRLLDLDTPGNEAGEAPTPFAGVLSVVLASADGVVVDPLPIDTARIAVAGAVVTIDGAADGQIAAVDYLAEVVYRVIDTPALYRDTWIVKKDPASEYAPLPVRSMCALVHWQGDAL